jgi:hypothetical protein
VRDGGHALAAAAPPALRQKDGLALAARPDGLTSAVRALSGFTGTGLVTAAGANAFGHHSATPYAFAASHPGGTALYVSLVRLARSEQDPPAPAVRVEPGDVVVLSLPGGGTVTVDMGAETPAARRHDPAERRP